MYCNHFVVTAEARLIKSQNVMNTVNDHRSHDSCIVHLSSCDSIFKDQSPPFAVDRLDFRQ